MIAGAMQAGAHPAAAPPAAAPAAAVPAAGQRREIKPGMSFDEVRAMFGNPSGEVVFGTRARWTFPDITVVFEDGKVTEVKF
jgi:hypothetical protein